MKKTTLNRIYYLTGVLLISLTMMAGAFAAEKIEAPPERVQKTLDTLLTAIKDGDYDTYSAQGNEQFKKATPKDHFDKFSEAAQKLMANGYDTEFLGHLSKQKNNIYVYKASFKGTDDKPLDDALIIILFNEAEELTGIFFQ